MLSEPGYTLDAMRENLDIQPVPAFRDNYIWLLRRGSHAAVVDPGDALPLIALIDATGLRLDAILVTHHHPDHVGGVVQLATRYGAVVYGPAAESITGVTVPLLGGESLDLDDLGARFDVWSVPGHTRGHLAYVGRDDAAGAVFCGDTLFGAGCGRLFEGTPAQMFAALGRFAALPDSTRFYCAHEYTAANLRFAGIVEPDSAAIMQRVQDVAVQVALGHPTVPFTLAEEKATNPFLRCDQPAVRAAAMARGAAADPLSVFTTIREWRNSF